MSVMRIKLKILPYEEKLCILVNKNSTINDLKVKVFNAIQHYAIYKQYLEFCAIHLELQIDSDYYGIPEHYALKDCLTDNDTVIVKFVDNKDYQYRSSIHMKYQTKSDLFINQNQSQNRNRHQTQPQFSNNKFPQRGHVKAMSPDFTMHRSQNEHYGTSTYQPQSALIPISENKNVCYTIFLMLCIPRWTTRLLILYLLLFLMIVYRMAVRK